MLRTHLAVALQRPRQLAPSLGTSLPRRLPQCLDSVPRTLCAVDLYVQMGLPSPRVP